MSAPAAATDVRLLVDGDLVSKPYITMTLKMMESFGVTVESPDNLASFSISPQRYTARTYDIEPDASAASYFLAVAAVTGGRVTVDGLTKTALQGDVHFATALEQMGCEVDWATDSVTVTGHPFAGRGHRHETQSVIPLKHFPWSRFLRIRRQQFATSATCATRRQIGSRRWSRNSVVPEFGRKSLTMG